ncbi:MAG: oxidoreductase, 2OG-Fe(II) oxygenase family protein [Caudoviricetes sp.]|nr:MAG: oxidoreductase, 2OG-Fe(II) oxygenase family protein [Caudoviricetes sp.]
MITQKSQNSVFNTIEYSTILSFYNTRRAERSKAFLMNHINEGLLILMEYERPLIELKAYCIHPIVQNGEDIDTSWSDAYELAIEYRDIANSYLCRPKNDYIKTLDDMKNKIKPMSIGCAYNLLADKKQNQKDFRLYHLGTHKRSNELEQYFINWINYLEFILKNCYND